MGHYKNTEIVLAEILENRGFNIEYNHRGAYLVYGKFWHELNSAEAAILFMKSQCDGAKSHDGKGFNKFDAKFGKSLANSIVHYGSLTPRQLRAIQPSNKKKGLLHKYRKQLANVGFDVTVLLK